jgi:hypothetical protein
MITRGKSRLRRGNLSTFIDSVVVPTTNEPLHFLYPRWASSGLLLSRLYSSRTSLPTRRPRPCGSFSGPSQRHRPLDTRSCRWLSHEGSTVYGDKVDLSDEPERNLASEDDQRESLDWVHGDSPEQDSYETQHSLSENIEDGNITKDVPIRMTPGRFVEEKKRLAAERIHARRKQTQVDDGYRDYIYNDSNFTEKVPIRMTASSGLSVDEKKRLAADRIRARKHGGLFGEPQTHVDAGKLSYREYVYKWRQEINGKRAIPPHWTEIMAMLERLHIEMAVTPKTVVHKEILVREEVVVQISGDISKKENMWFIEIRNGCRVRVLDAVESEGIFRKVVISGTRRAVELVDKQIKQVDEQQVAATNLPPDERRSMTRSPLPIIPSILAYKKTGQPVPTIWGHWDDRIITKGDPLNRRRRKFRDVRDFVRYVEQLITARPKLRTEPGDTPYINRVAERLRFIFVDPENRKCLSTYALNQAMTFLCEHEYLDSARDVFKAAQTVATIQSYNIFFRSTARRQDFNFFKARLSEMGKLGIQPDGFTWVAFADSLVSPGPKTQVIQRMTELGFLKDRRVELDVVQNNIGLILFPHLSSGLGIESFLEELEQKYGYEIISTYTLNLILEQITPRRDTDLLTQVLECFKKYDLTPDSRTFNLGLSHFRGMDVAQAVMSSCLHEHEQALSPGNYEKMFRMAINANMYNTCRVIWRYACSIGATTPLMRHIVWSSLAGIKKGQSREETKIEYHLGALVVGLEYMQKVRVDENISKNAPSEVPRYLAVHLVQDMEPASSERKELAGQLVWDDVEHGPERVVIESFNMMMHAATMLDKETRWHSNDPDYPAMGRRSTVEILKEVMEVPIE